MVGNVTMIILGIEYGVIVLLWMASLSQNMLEDKSIGTINNISL